MPDPLPTTITKHCSLLAGLRDMPGKTQENPTIFGPERGEGQNLAGRSPQRCLEPAYFSSPLYLFIYLIWYCGLCGGLFHLRAWLLTMVPKRGLI